MEESVGSSDETLSIQDVDDLPEDEQIMALKTKMHKMLDAYYTSHSLPFDAPLQAIGSGIANAS